MRWCVLVWDPDRGLPLTGELVGPFDREERALRMMDRLQDVADGLRVSVDCMVMPLHTGHGPLASILLRVARR